MKPHVLIFLIVLICLSSCTISRSCNVDSSKKKWKYYNGVQFGKAGKSKKR